MTQFVKGRISIDNIAGRYGSGLIIVFRVMICYFQFGKEVHSMTMTAQKVSTMTGPQLVHAFLDECSIHLNQVSEGCAEGTPQEIVWDVVADTARFDGCSAKAINGLARQLVMAVQAHGHRYSLRCMRLADGRIKVAVA